MHLQKDNNGTSLIELVIAMAIAAIVLSMLIFFTSGAVNGFRKASNEVNLQMEAQTVINQISNLAMEAEAFEVYRAESETRYMFKHKENLYYSIIFQIEEGSLYLMEENTLELAKTAIPDKKYHFLAEYIDRLEIVSDSKGKKVLIKLKLDLGKDSYEISKTVTLRNKINQ